MNNKEIAFGGISIALIAIGTFYIAVPVGPGYLNPSDAMIGIIALVFGRKIGAISGFGAVIADLLLGFTAYAPFTLVTKCLTGFLVGSAARRKTMATLSAVISMVIMVLIYFFADLFVVGFSGSISHILGNLVQGMVAAAIIIIFSLRNKKIVNL